MAPPTHISVLPPEILGSIFAINANLDVYLEAEEEEGRKSQRLAPDSDDDCPVDSYKEPIHLVDDNELELRRHPLSVTRHSSHVCSSWRWFLLNSPALWGSLIHLDMLLRDATHEWREEVLSRARSSPLDIRGILDAHYQTGMEFFVGILQSKWPQIRRLDVEFRWVVLRLPNAIVDAVTCPAPELVQFSLIGDGRYRLTNFTSDAPHLTSLQLDSNALNLRAPWRRQLRLLSIYTALWGTPPLFSSQEFLDDLRDMTVLESLEIQRTRMVVNVDLEAPIVVLPQLKRLSINDEAAILCAFILRHILPQPGRTLSIYATTDRRHASKPPITTSSPSALAAALHQHFVQCSFGPHVYVAIGSASIQISDNQLERGKGGVNFSFSFDALEDVGSVRSSFLSVFAQGDFQDTTTLQLSIGANHLLPSAQHAALVLLRSFRSVQSLKICGDAFWVMSKLSETHGKEIFPQLRKLKPGCLHSDHSERQTEWKLLVEEFVRFYGLREIWVEGEQADSSFILDIRNQQEQKAKLETVKHLSNLTVAYRGSGKTEYYVCRTDQKVDL
ncbi:hypothetical protein NLJ89_g4496 [Agrocybe chaxingu]|uniref:F-box domain-containing protein n=1 Tax=Agrocybe chaxingu TaxID=84603 RepID=A0A9W8K3Z3_9AGAR|nr:hypothetical protein NLJ89_g4496 [Agrocybe chaxingu]